MFHDHTVRPMAPSSQPQVRVREQHAELIRDAILTAARRLFAERGFPGTSVRLLAAEAGVAVQTIYSSFGDKAGVLTALLNRVADERRVAESRAEMLAADTPEEIARAVARMHRELFEQGGEMATMLRAAAATDSQLVVVYRELSARRRRGVDMVCRKLVELGALEPGQTDAVAAHIEALLRLETWEAGMERGWSPERYERWLRDALQRVVAP